MRARSTVGPHRTPCFRSTRRILPLLDLKIKRLDEARPQPRVIRPGILPPELGDRRPKLPPIDRSVALPALERSRVASTAKVPHWFDEGGYVSVRNPDAAGRYGNVATGSGSDAGKGRPPAAAVTGNPSPTKASSSFRGSTVIFAFPAYNPG